MREILFRGKRLDNGEWVYGNVLDGKYIVGQVLDFCEDYFNSICWAAVDPSTIGQYTGLDDWSGTKIFEGDIVRFINKFIERRGVGVVSYSVDNSCWFMEFEDFPQKIPMFDVVKEAVVGNIHDALELLDSLSDEPEITNAYEVFLKTAEAAPVGAGTASKEQD